MAIIYIGQKLGSIDRIRKHVDMRVPRSAGCVTFLRDGLVVEVVNTSSMRETVYERVCGWRNVHIHARLDYADQVEICEGTVEGDVQYPKNETYCAY
ncbi:hypothetical protein [Methanosarcina horonobensis]|uniref:hypothetical protein n=1 Tax=Methanosarcina horonobensis TaxID=418008 RepID=UPI00064E7CA3|nr:hypothetical protein [Methanosarcina horonobensis]